MAQLLRMPAGMECLISVVQAGGPRVVRVAGRLSEAQVPDLLRVYAADTAHVQIDLGELMSADGVGLEALHRLSRSGALIVNAPRFIDLALDTMSRGLDGQP